MLVDDCRHNEDHSQVYTFSSPPTVIEAPRIRVSPPRPVDIMKRPVSDSVDKSLPVTDDSGTECEPECSPTTAVLVSPGRHGSCFSDTHELPDATRSQLSPSQHTFLRSSLREIPEDEIRRSGVRTF